MRRRKSWTSIEEMFGVLSKNDIYVVLTGDELLERKFTELGPHHDIDILVVNQKRTAELIGARKCAYYAAEHYKVNICCKNLTMGIYELGDDYMDSQWQKEMLQSRILHPAGHYIMDSQNHFYWMLYHVLCQKKYIPEHYRIRILEEASMLGITVGADVEMWRILELFLIEREYSCPYPKAFIERIYTGGFQIVQPSGYGKWKMKRIRNLPIRVIRYIYRRYLK